MSDPEHEQRVAPHEGRDAGSFRVEHRLEGQAPAVLARIEGCFPHHAELAPYDAHLRLIGHTRGVVVLVDEATDEVVARRHLQRSARPRPAPNGGPNGAAKPSDARPTTTRPPLPPALRRR